jgi:hypothetical protein
VLRVNGVNLNFRTWAGYGDFLPVMWDALRENLETEIFENAADQARAEAVRIAARLGRFDVRSQLALGESQSYQIRKALDLYHYINPKLLVLKSAVGAALSGEELRGGSVPSDLELIERGIPAHMYPMEMVSDKPDLFVICKGIAACRGGRYATTRTAQRAARSKDGRFEVSPSGHCRFTRRHR